MGGWGGGGIEGQAAEEEPDVAELKRLGIGSSAGVFPRPQEEKKGDAEHVGKGLVDGVVGQGGLSHDMTQDGHGNRFHPGRRIVMARVGRQLSLEAEVDPSHGVEAGILGPHTSERLSNAA